MEPVHSDEPRDNFLQKVRAIADRIGAVLVFDEITIGWKLCYGGAHLRYGVNPDMAVFAKAMSNGYPMAAIIGKREVMQAAQDTFISSTYWTERIGPTAALATLKKMKLVNMAKYLLRVSKSVKKIWNDLAKKHGIEIETAEVPIILSIAFKGQDGREVKTFYTQEMLRRGILVEGSFYATYAHTDAHLKQYKKAADEVFGLIADARANGGVKKHLIGPVAHGGFQRLN